MRWIAGLILLVSSSAMGQDAAPRSQTPENAQIFLQLIAEQADIRTSPQADGLIAAYNVRFSAAETCVTRIEGVPLAYQRNGRWVFKQAPDFNLAEFAEVLRRGSLISPPWLIDWRQVSTATILTTAEWPNRLITLRGLNGTRTFYLPDEATTKRIHYAMQFLKEHCDKTAETGF